MDKADELVTLEQLTRSTAYNLVRFDALQKTVLEFLNLSKEQEKEFLERLKYHVKNNEKMVLNPDVINSWVKRS